MHQHHRLGGRDVRERQRDLRAPKGRPLHGPGLEEAAQRERSGTVQGEVVGAAPHRPGWFGRADPGRVHALALQPPVLARSGRPAVDLPRPVPRGRDRPVVQRHGPVDR